MKIYTPQLERIFLFILYVFALAIVHQYIFGELPQPGQNQSLWFWSACLSLFLGELVAQPYFTAPKDSFANALAIIVVLIGLNQPATAQLATSWNWLGSLAGIILVASLLAMGLKDNSRARLVVAAEILTKIAALFGSPRVIFTALFLFCVQSFHQDFRQAFGLLVAWLFFVIGNLPENALNHLKKWWSIYSTRDKKAMMLGSIVSRREPYILIFQVCVDKMPKYATVVMTPTDDSHGQLGFVVDGFYLSETKWCKVKIVEPQVTRERLKGIWGRIGSVVECDISKIEDVLNQSEEFIRRNDFIGVVIENSDVTRIHVELMRHDIELFEGQLLLSRINNVEVMYQIVNATTSSEALETSNKHGYVSIEARKLGKWDESNRIFQQFQWLPDIFSPVFLAPTNSQYSFDERFVGHFPRTVYGVELHCKELVTHNTAILGVLGSGKTSLALELVKRMIREGIKIWIIDITGQYSEELGPLLKRDLQDTTDNKIIEKILKTASLAKDDRGSGGNHLDFAKAVNEHIMDFLNNTEWKVRVFDPGVYNVTEQTSFKNSNSAGFSRLTPAQITRIVAEELLNCLKSTMSEKARLCLVLEEAHSLIPEWSSVAHDGDKNATNGTAKAILQGRKYGFGCLLITQRTANVTKSILNQCNTIFGLRVYDDTGMDFLRNYIGNDYASVLATLPDRHCVAFGRGINASAPLIIQLNNREDFNQHFRIENTPNELPESEHE